MNRAFDEVVCGFARESTAIPIAPRCRGDPEGGRFLVAEHLGEGSGELHARRTVWDRERVAGNFLRVENVHVDMDVDLVDERGQALHLGVDLFRAMANVVGRDVLDLAAVEELLLERIRVAHRAHDDIALREGNVETGF